MKKIKCVLQFKPMTISAMFFLDHEEKKKNSQCSLKYDARLVGEVTDLCLVVSELMVSGKKQVLASFPPVSHILQILFCLWVKRKHFLDLTKFSAMLLSLNITALLASLYWHSFCTQLIFFQSGRTEIMQWAVSLTSLVEEVEKETSRSSNTWENNRKKI